MPPAAKKTTAAPKKSTPKKEAPVTETVTEETTAPKKRPGRKPDPLTPLWKAYRDAAKKAEKARAARAKVTALDEALADAESAEQAAYTELQEALGKIPAPPVAVDNTADAPAE